MKNYKSIFTPLPVFDFDNEEKMAAEGWIRLDEGLLRHLASHIPIIGHAFKDRSTKIHYDPHLKIFAGQVHGQRFKSTSEKGMYKRLIDKHGYHPDKASEFINHTKKSFEDAKSHDSPSFHSGNALHHYKLAQYAHHEGNQVAKQKHISQGDMHVDKALEMHKKMIRSNAPFQEKEEKAVGKHLKSIQGINNNMDASTSPEEHRKIATVSTIGNNTGPKKKMSAFDYRPGRMNEDGEESDEKKPLTKEKKPLSRLVFHKDPNSLDGKNGWFHGHILDQEIKAMPEPKLRTHLTGVMNFDPAEANAIIKAAKDPVANDEKIKTHASYSKLWKSYAKKATDPDRQAEFNKGAVFHARRARILGAKKGPEEENVDDDVFGDKNVPKSAEAKKDLKKVVQKESVSPYELVSVNGSSRFHSRNNQVTEGYVNSLIVELSQLFSEDQVSQILLSDITDWRVPPVLEAWCKMGPLRKQRVYNVQNALNEVKKPQKKSDTPELEIPQKEDVIIPDEDVVLDLEKVGFSASEVASLREKSELFQTDELSEGVSRAHFQALVNHIHATPEEHKEAVTSEHVKIMKSMHPNFKPELFGRKAKEGQQYHEKGTLPKLTRKDFQHIADHLKHVESGPVKEHLIDHYTSIGHRSNPLFNRSKFHEASSKK